MVIVQFILTPILALLLSPLLLGIVNKTKAFFAGRKGAPLFQLYYDLYRLFNKESVISKTTSFIFRIAPSLVFGTALSATTLLPFVSDCNSFHFMGDFVLLFYLLGLGRFFLILSAMDTGSAFEGMGASREAFFSALTEPIVFTCILTVLRMHHSTSIINAFSCGTSHDWVLMIFIALPIFVIMLVENARIPFDDPNTHLELTMIHEVMILDNSGIDLALFEYASALKFWIFNLLLAKIIISVININMKLEILLIFILMCLSSVIVGIVESIMARSNMIKIPKLIYGAGVIACLALFISISGILK